MTQCLVGSVSHDATKNLSDDKLSRGMKARRTLNDFSKFIKDTPF